MPIGARRAPPADLAGQRLAVDANYLPRETLQQAYPQATLHYFPSSEQALAAVAYGQADVFIGDALTTSHLVSQSYFNDVRVVAPAQIVTGGNPSACAPTIPACCGWSMPCSKPFRPPSAAA